MPKPSCRMRRRPTPMCWPATPGNLGPAVERSSGAATGVGRTGRRCWSANVSAEGRERLGLSMPGLQPNYVPTPRLCVTQACSNAAPVRSCCQPSDDLFGNYLRRYAVHIYTPKELGQLAVRGVIDPFNC